MWCETAELLWAVLVWAWRREKIVIKPSSFKSEFPCNRVFSENWIIDLLIWLVARHTKCSFLTWVFLHALYSKTFMCYCHTPLSIDTKFLDLQLLKSSSDLRFLFHASIWFDAKDFHLSKMLPVVILIYIVVVCFTNNQQMKAELQQL